MTNAVITAQQGSSQGGDIGFKNRIINGDMRIDQRNAGAAITSIGVYNWPVDRFRFTMGITSGATLQRVVDAPAGFIYSTKLTCTTGQSPAAGQYMNFGQPIEGYNVADFAFGTSAAQTVTLSFWVKSNLTGTFGGCLANYGGSNRTYVFQYTILSANTWEYKTITIPGDTSGITWPVDNTMGMYVLFSMGDGTLYQGTANTWASADYRFASGNVRPMLTQGATWQVTGMQLEAGTTATGFDYRSFPTEFAMCQRYYEKSFPLSIAPNNSTGLNYLAPMCCWAGTGHAPILYKVTKRTGSVSVSTYGNGGVLGFVVNGTLPTTQSGVTWATNLAMANMDETKCSIGNNYSQSTLFNIFGGWSADAEL